MKFSTILLDVIVLFLFGVNIKSKSKIKGNEGFELRDCMKCCKCCKGGPNNQDVKKIRTTIGQVITVFGPDGKPITKHSEKAKVIKILDEVLKAKKNGVLPGNSLIENGVSKVKKPLPDVKMTYNDGKITYEFDGNKIVVEKKIVPVEEYYDKDHTIGNFDEDGLKKKSVMCVDKATKQNVDVSMLAWMVDDAIKRLDEIQKKNLNDKHFTNVKPIKFRDTNNIEYLYARYITRGNNVRLIRDIIFDFRKDGFDFNNEQAAKECWQVKMLNCKNGFQNVSLKPEGFGSGKYILTFDKESFSLYHHHVINSMHFIKDEDDSLIVCVSSNAVGRDGKDPSIFTGIVYAVMYDLTTDSTFLLILSTFSYTTDANTADKPKATVEEDDGGGSGFFIGKFVKGFGKSIAKATANFVMDKFNAFEGQVRGEGKATYECLVGSVFSSELKAGIEKRGNISLDVDKLPGEDSSQKNK